MQVKQEHFRIVGFILYVARILSAARNLFFFWKLFVDKALLWRRFWYRVMKLQVCMEKEDWAWCRPGCRSWHVLYQSREKEAERKNGIKNVKVFLVIWFLFLLLILFFPAQSVCLMLAYRFHMWWFWWIYLAIMLNHLGAKTDNLAVFPSLAS